MSPSPTSQADPAGVLQSCDDVVVLLTNAPDMLLAKRIAHVLVEERYAACVNLGAPGLSMYMWQGGLEGIEEVPMVIKTHASRAEAAAQRLRSLHPYDVPEILVLPVAGGSAAYLDWVRAQTGSAHPPGGGGVQC
ncbi:divalent-cation tolerance protein CutA [Paracandidimonas lactea]|uniref:divalent-cation tolerance protein CutA n=1 Tax=Paracandidimonas lactea TaxID=2895524 RepID=UPI0034E1EF95